MKYVKDANRLVSDEHIEELFVERSIREKHKHEPRLITFNIL